MAGRWRRRIGRLAAVLAAVATMACAAASSDGSESPTSPAPAAPVNWQAYTNAEYGFGVAYPEEYGIVPETTAPPSGAAARVRFQDKALLTSQFVDLEPARFMVEVFILAGQTPPLREWLRTANRLPAGAVMTSITLAGASEGLKVQQPQQLAPNEFYYYARGGRVYAVTPLGANSAEMLASFRLF
ncbi:MAG: hypothetical protein ABI868_08520 [Acidobacteriota bacterium]